MTKGDEERLEKKISPLIEEVSLKYNLKLVSKIKIISDLTGIIKEKGFQFYFSFSEVDIALYKQFPFDKTHKRILEFFTFFHDSKDNKAHINVPLVVIELKSGRLYFFTFSTFQNFNNQGLFTFFN